MAYSLLDKTLSQGDPKTAFLERGEQEDGSRFPTVVFSGRTRNNQHNVKQGEVKEMRQKVSIMRTVNTGAKRPERLCTQPPF